MRSAHTIEVHVNKFADQVSLDASAFLREWQSSLNPLSQIEVAEFQITATDIAQPAGSNRPLVLKTRVRFEIVGKGAGFHREQPVADYDRDGWLDIYFCLCRETDTGTALCPDSRRNLVTQRRDEAVASFEKCIRVAPAFDQAYLNLARVYALQGARDKAQALLQELLTEHPGHPQATQMMQQLQQ